MLLGSGHSRAPTYSLTPSYFTVLLHIIPLYKLSSPTKLVEFLNMLCALFFVIPSIFSLCFVSVKNFLIFKDSMKFQTSMKPSLTTLTGCNINFFKFLKLLLMWQLLSSMWHYNFLFTWLASLLDFSLLEGWDHILYFLVSNKIFSIVLWTHLELSTWLINYYLV